MAGYIHPPQARDTLTTGQFSVDACLDANPLRRFRWLMGFPWPTIFLESGAHIAIHRDLLDDPWESWSGGCLSLRHNHESYSAKRAPNGTYTIQLETPEGRRSPIVTGASLHELAAWLEATAGDMHAVVAGWYR